MDGSHDMIYRCQTYWQLYDAIKYKIDEFPPRWTLTEEIELSYNALNKHISTCKLCDAWFKYKADNLIGNNGWIMSTMMLTEDAVYKG